MTNFSGAMLSHSKFMCSDFYSANLSGGFFNGANFEGAIFRQTILSGANLTVANMEGADLSGAVGLTRAQLETTLGTPAKYPEVYAEDAPPPQ